MSAGRLFDEPGGASDDAARIAALEAELDASRLQAEARRVENEQLREELANERTRAVGDSNAGGEFSGSAAPSPETLAGMLATLEARQGDLAARAAGEHGGDVGDVQVVGRDLVEVVEASRRLQGLCAAVQAEALAGLNEVQHVPVLPAEVSSAAMRAETLTGAEAGAALMTSRDSARLRTEDSLVLTRLLTRTLAALRVGDVTQWHVRTLLPETGHLADEQRLAVEAAVLEDATGQTAWELRRKVKKVLARLAPNEAEQANARARAGRRVWAQPGLDGMGTFGAEVPVEDLAALMTAIEAAAAAAKTADPDDGRSMDNRRADALAAMGWSALAQGHIGAPAPTSRGTNAETSTWTHSDSTTTGTEASSPSAQPDAGDNSAQRQDTGQDSAQGSARDGPGRCCCGAVSTESSAAAGSAAGSVAGSAGGGLRLQNTRGKPVTVNVTVPYSTRVALDEHPGRLAGYGTITADVARRIATTGTWRRILTDPVNGAPLDYGRTRYEPPPDLAAFIALRDGQCTFPGCNRTAHTSQVDHTTPYGHGGTTAHTNLGCLDQVCHLLKTFAGWTITQDPHRPGRFNWTSPLGYRHTVEPEPVGPIVEPTVGPREDDIPPF